MFRLFHEIQVNGLISRNLYVENLEGLSAKNLEIGLRRIFSEQFN